MLINVDVSHAGCAQATIPAGEPATDDDLRGQHHAEYVEMGGRENRDKLGIAFPEFATTNKKVSWPACYHVACVLLQHAHEIA